MGQDRTETRAGRGARRAARRGATRTRLPGSPQARRRRKAVAGCIVIVLLVLGLAGAGAAAVWWTLYRPAAEVAAGRTVSVTVPKGASTGEIGEQLAAEGIVPNATMFGMVADRMGAAGRLKPGEYELTTGSAYEPVIATLVKGPTIVYHTVTIPEGWTIDRIAKRVEDKTGIPASEFEQLATTGAKRFDFAFLADNPTDSLQGYLFPKTYSVREGSTAEDVIRMMLAQYGRETASIDYGYASSRKLTGYDVLIIASIIEREASVDSDRPLVSSVVYNRLKRRMRLEMCSTVQFILGNKPKLTYADTRVKSPYNTYLNPGLPPGPIASPGLASLQAAAKPASTSYLYYVLTHKDGRHSFSADYDRFLADKARAARGLK